MGVRLGLLAKDQRDSAFAIATAMFVSGSTLHRALGIGLVEYRTYLRPSFDAMISENLSVVALDDETGAVVGCVIGTDFANLLAPGDDPPEAFKPLVAMTRALCRRYWEKRPLNAGQVVLLDMAFVAAGYEGQGIYQHMRAAAHQLAKHKGFSRVVGELSSAATQHVVLDQLGHEKVAEIGFSDFEFRGHTPFAGILEPTSIILAEGHL